MRVLLLPSLHIEQSMTALETYSLLPNKLELNI